MIDTHEAKLGDFAETSTLAATLAATRGFEASIGSTGHSTPPVSFGDSEGVSFATAWLVSGREHLPRLTSDFNEGRDGDSWDNSIGEGTGANSEGLQMSVATVKG